MKIPTLLLLLLATVTYGSDSLQQKLATRSLLIPHIDAHKTLPQALGALGADYKAHYDELLPIYISVELAPPPLARDEEDPSHFLPEFTPTPNSTIGDSHAVPTDDSSLRVPVVEILRLLTGRGGAAFTIHGDLILVHPLLVSPQDEVDIMLSTPKNPLFSFDTLYGSPESAATLKAPERVEVYRITPHIISEPPPGTAAILGHQILGDSALLPQLVRDELVALLSAHDTFTLRPFCGGEPGVLLRALSGAITVDLLFCFKCGDVAITRNDGQLSTIAPHLDEITVGMTRVSAQKFLRIFQSLFPNDDELKAVLLK